MRNWEELSIENERLCGTMFLCFMSLKPNYRFVHLNCKDDSNIVIDSNGGF